MASKPTKRPRLTIDVPQDIRRRVKARAAMEDMTVSQWILGLILDEILEEEGARLGADRLSELDDTITLEALHQERMVLEQPGEL